MLKCVFFDRDGIVNESPGPGYVERWEDFKLIPEFGEVLRVIQDSGYEAAIVTNQRGIALGRLSRETLEEIHSNLRMLLQERYGVSLLDIRYCPHENGQCSCRKPQPGMLVEAAEIHGIDLGKSWMVGDSERDIEAGQRAGCRTILVSGKDSETRADFRVKNMVALKELLKTCLERR